MKSRLIIALAFCLGVGGGEVGAVPWEETAKLWSQEPDAGDSFGCSVSMAGDLVLLGAYGDDDFGPTAGAAYVFAQRADGTWGQVQKLTPEDAAAHGWFGSAVALDGSYAIVGAPFDDAGGATMGAAYVFQNIGGSWTQVDELRPSGLTGSTRFGSSVAMDGSLAVVGAPYSSAAWLYQNVGGTWTEIEQLTPSGSGVYPYFGDVVDIADCTVIVGARLDYDDGIRCGAAYIYRDEGQGEWKQIARLAPSDPQVEQDFGTSVSLCGNIAVVGADYDNHAGENTGAVYWFYEDAGAWHEGGKITAPDAAAYDLFGHAVSVEGDTVLIGAYGDDDMGSVSGSAYVYRYGMSGWTLVEKLTASDGNRYEHFGMELVLDDGRALIGSPANYNLQIDRSAEGDANGDTRINGGDLALWQTGYDPLGTLGPHSAADGDFNGDGRVDGGDLALWQVNYDPLGLTNSGAAYLFDELVIEAVPGAEAIPEPATLAIGLVGAAGLFAVRKRPGRTGQRR